MSTSIKVLRIVSKIIPNEHTNFQTDKHKHVSRLVLHSFRRKTEIFWIYRQRRIIIARRQQTT